MMNAHELTSHFPLAQPVQTETAAQEIPEAPTVLFVDQSGQLGGAEFSLLPLASACTSRGKVVLLSEGPFRGRLEALGVRVQVINEARVSGINRDAMQLNWLRALPGIWRQV